MGIMWRREGLEGYGDMEGLVGSDLEGRELVAAGIREEVNQE